MDGEDEVIEFMCLHRDDCGTLLHVETVQATEVSWEPGRHVVALPKIDMRCGDTLTMERKPPQRRADEPSAVPPADGEEL